jgi:predicted SAM-dependent methyltransferase
MDKIESDICRKKCAVCNSDLKHIYNLDNVPIKLSCTSTPQFEKKSMSYSSCVMCNTIQLDKLIPLEQLYSDSHNYVSVGQTWTDYFNLFIENITPIIRDKNILEVGCPSGKLALKANYYKKWYIVEPNKNSSVLFHDKIEFIEKYFDDNFILNEQIDVIVHSHLFEHIYEPNIFLKKCNQILCEDGVMFFGVPNMEYFVDTKLSPFFGVFFEHTIFLNKKNITYMLNKNGFELIDIIEYENHSVLYHCKKKNTFEISNTSQLILDENINRFYESVNYYKNFVDKCNSIINSTEKKVYIFGASYISQILLSLGLNIEKINGILDNCKDKHNKYLYGYNLQIFSPNIITDNAIIILKNGYYVNEISKQLKEINNNIEIIS